MIEILPIKVPYTLTIRIKYNLNDLYPFKDDIIIYSRDKYGFRGKYLNPQSIDILSIGGSPTDQRYISEGYTFEDIMHDQFKKINKNVYIVNAGIDGQSTYGHIKNFDLWFPYIPNLKVKYFFFILELMISTLDLIKNMMI